MEEKKILIYVISQRKTFPSEPGDLLIDWKTKKKGDGGYLFVRLGIRFTVCGGDEFSLRRFPIGKKLLVDGTRLSL